MDLLQLALDSGGSVVVVQDGIVYRVSVSKVGELATAKPAPKPKAATAPYTGKRRGRPPKAKSELPAESA